MKLKKFVKLLNDLFEGFIEAHIYKDDYISIERFPERSEASGNFVVDFHQEHQADVSFSTIKQVFKLVSIPYQSVHVEGIFPQIIILKNDIESQFSFDELFPILEWQFAEHKAKALPIEPLPIPQYTTKVKHTGATTEEWEVAKCYFERDPTATILSKKTTDCIRHSFIRTYQQIMVLGELIAEGKAFTKVKWVETEDGLVGVAKIEFGRLDRRKLAESRIARRIGYLYGMTQCVTDPWELKTSFTTKKRNTKTYSVSPYLPGISLKEYFLLHKNKLANETILAIELACCEIIFKLQLWRLIHGDIKPENFLILIEEERFTVFLLDFESAMKKSKFKNSVTRHSAYGTRGYIAPEIVNDEIVNDIEPEYSYRSEIYALGRMLNEVMRYCLGEGVEKWKELTDLYRLMVDKFPSERPPLKAVIEKLLYLGKTHDVLDPTDIDRINVRLCEFNPRNLILQSTLTYTPQFKKIQESIIPSKEIEKISANLEKVKFSIDKP